jgi:hypothetical protein
MDEMTEKYLSRMLEGAEGGLKQVEAAIEGADQQREMMQEQKDEMVTAIAELKDLLGLEEEEDEAPALKLVEEESE